LATSSKIVAPTVKHNYLRSLTWAFACSRRRSLNLWEEKYWVSGHSRACHN